MPDPALQSCFVPNYFLTIFLGFPIPTTPSFDPNNNDILDSNGGLKHERSECFKVAIRTRPNNLPLIEVSACFDEFDMGPLETVSPIDFLAPLKQDDSVFFVGSLNVEIPFSSRDA